MAPSVGRIVHFLEGTKEPSAAIITRVHSPSCVNLTVFFDDGRVESRSSVQDEVTGNRDYGVWSWPPRT